MNVVFWFNIFLIRFLQFTEDHKLQLHLSRNKLFWVCPVVHKGVQMLYKIMFFVYWVMWSFIAALLAIYSGIRPAGGLHCADTHNLDGGTSSGK